MRLASCGPAVGLCLLLNACGGTSSTGTAPAGSSAAPPTALAKPSSAAPATPASAKAPASSNAVAASAPVKFRIGRGVAAEEQLWLMEAMPSITPNQGKAYTLEETPFRGNADRMNAYQAGQLDGGTITAATALAAAQEGLPLKLVASIALESEKGFRTSAAVLSDSGITSAKDLKGKKIAIVDYKSSTELWAREGAKKAGLNPDRDVTFAVIAFPAQGEALRSHKIDAAILPQPFFAIEMAKGGVKKIFDSKEAVPFDEELLDIALQPKFVQDHPAAVKAFLSDFVTATKWYTANRERAEAALVKGKYLQGDPKTLASYQDWYRPLDGRINVDDFQRMEDLIAQEGWLDKKPDLKTLTDNSYLPG